MTDRQWLVVPPNRVVTPYKSARTAAVRYVVLHDTATPWVDGGDEARIRRWLSGKGSKSSTHFVICQGGRVLQAAPLDTVTWHAGKGDWAKLQSMNAVSIGIDFECAGKLSRGGLNCYGKPHLGPIDKLESGWWSGYTHLQYASFCELALELLVRYPVLMERKRWIRHANWTKRKVDVGENFDWSVLDAAITRMQERGVQVLRPDDGRGD